MLNYYRKISQMAYWLLMPVLQIRCCLEGSDSLWCGRMGKVPPEVEEMSPYDIWFQAVSVGEVNVAEALVRAIDALNPGLKVIVSSTTPTGLARASSLFKSRCTVISYPLDFPQAVSRMVATIRPKVYAPLETELWPNMLEAVTASGAKAVLLNGRISSRSFRRYKLIENAVKPMLNKFTAICAISDTYARRFVELGAATEKVAVAGNAKFEGLLNRPNVARAESLRAKLRIGHNEKVFVAGSIRKGEEIILAQAMEDIVKEMPASLFFIVPRHLARVSEVTNCLKQRSLGFDMWSELEVGKRREHNIVVVDVIGPLFDLYGLADVAFVGGSLVPKGGQNIMEPAAWGCPVLFGPSTDNFEESSQALLQLGGGRLVKDVSDLGRQIREFFSNEKLTQKTGQRALQALKQLAQNSATRQAQLILEVLSSTG